METKKLKNSLNDNEPRSAGMRNLLNKHPHWFILKGNFLISMALIFILIVVGCFVKYPKFVVSKIIINSKNFQNNSNDKNIIGVLSISQNEVKKIKAGQKVIIKLYDFPYQEFGVLEGQVQNISFTQNTKGNYSVDVVLPNGLKTSYNKSLPYNKELKGSTKIITESMRLIEIIFYQ